MRNLSQREIARINYYRELVEQQLLDYKKVRREAEICDRDLAQLNEYSKELDKRLEDVWVDAQEAINTNELFRETYNTLMEQEDVQVHQTADFIQETVPIRDELFETLCVTNNTERLAVKNAADLQAGYRRSMKELTRLRNNLQDEVQSYRESYDNIQEQRKAIYDEIQEKLEKIELADVKAEIDRINNLKL